MNAVLGMVNYSAIWIHRMSDQKVDDIAERFTMQTIHSLTERRSRPAIVCHAALNGCCIATQCGQHPVAWRMQIGIGGRCDPPVLWWRLTMCREAPATQRRPAPSGGFTSGHGLGGASARRWFMLLVSRRRPCAGVLRFPAPADSTPPGRHPHVQACAPSRSGRRLWNA